MRRVVVLELDQCLAGRVHPLVAFLHLCAGTDLIDKPKLLEGPHHLVVEASSAGKVVETLIPLEDDDLAAELSKQSGQSHTRRAVPDDGNVKLNHCSAP